MTENLTANMTAFEKLHIFLKKNPDVDHIALLHAAELHTFRTALQKPESDLAQRRHAFFARMLGQFNNALLAEYIEE